MNSFYPSQGSIFKHIGSISQIIKKTFQKIGTNFALKSYKIREISISSAHL